MRKFFKKKYKNSKTINLIVIILAVVVFIFVLVSNNLQLSSTRNLQDAYEKQQKYQDMALSLQDTSDFLTNQVRIFAVTGDIDYFYQYWDEAKNVCSWKICSWLQKCFLIVRLDNGMTSGVKCTKLNGLKDTLYINFERKWGRWKQRRIYLQPMDLRS